MNPNDKQSSKENFPLPPQVLMDALEAAMGVVPEAEYGRLKDLVSHAISYESSGLEAKSRRQMRLALELAQEYRERVYSVLVAGFFPAGTWIFGLWCSLGLLVLARWARFCESVEDWVLCF